LRPHSAVAPAPTDERTLYNSALHKTISKMAGTGARITLIRTLLLLMLVAPAASFHSPSVLTFPRAMAPVRAQLLGGAAPSLSLPLSPDGLVVRKRQLCCELGAQGLTVVVAAAVGVRGMLIAQVDR